MSENDPTVHATYVVVHPGAELFGSDRMLLESTRGLVNSGARVIVALPEGGPLVAHLRESGAEVVILPMLVLRKSLLRPSGWLTLLRSALRGAAAAWRLLGRTRPAAVYISTITIPQWPLISRLRGIRAVSHVHEAEASASRMINAILYAPHLASRTVLVNSEFSLRTIRATLPRLARRAHVVYNGVAGPEQFSPARLDVPQLRVLYVGRLSPRKGVDDLMNAVSILHQRGRGARLSLLGSVFTGYEWYEQELRALADEIGDDAVDFLGFHPDVWSVIDDHDVLVVPSRVDEPFGNTAVEGVLARRPVIASDTSGLREAAGGYSTTRFVTPGSPDALADALERVQNEWHSLLPLLEDSGVRAEERHAPETYRSTVLTAIRDALVD